jgi:hypothetical protein
MAGPARQAGSFQPDPGNSVVVETGPGVGRGGEWASAEGGRPCVDDSNPCGVSRYMMGTGPRWGLALETA